ncbi:phosphatase PAP2 family protein [Actinomyces culturomici]|uniref:phosphatase PAP2 family protein n=1 Tax=Actinomyces culturomici TaxID=1926276 RepID=UPI000E1FB8DE|nr:phosphatase PAP2 family protein [Actinomyces culturomici]
MSGPHADAPRPLPGESARIANLADNLGAWRIVSGVLLLVGAVVLGLFVRTRALTALDQSVLAWFISVRTPALTAFMQAVTSVFAPRTAILETLVIGVVIGAATRSWRLGVYIPGTMALSSLATVVVKLGIERIRPAMPERLVVELTASYPSGHTTAAASLAMAAAVVVLAATGWRTVALDAGALTWRRNRRTAAVWAIAALVTLLVGVSRLYLGAHWLSDVIGGAMVGTGVPLVCAGLVFGDEDPLEADEA